MKWRGILEKIDLVVEAETEEQAQRLMWYELRNSLSSEDIIVWPDWPERERVLITPVRAKKEEDDGA